MFHSRGDSFILVLLLQSGSVVEVRYSVPDDGVELVCVNVAIRGTEVLTQEVAYASQLSALLPTVS